LNKYYLSLIIKEMESIKNSFLAIGKKYETPRTSDEISISNYFIDRGTGYKKQSEYIELYNKEELDFSILKFLGGCPHLLVSDFIRELMDSDYKFYGKYTLLEYSLTFRHLELFRVIISLGYKISSNVNIELVYLEKEIKKSDKSAIMNLVEFHHILRDISQN
jgi:hypothetical protein